MHARCPRSRAKVGVADIRVVGRVRPSRGPSATRSAVSTATSRRGGPPRARLPRLSRPRGIARLSHGHACDAAGSHRPLERLSAYATAFRYSLSPMPQIEDLSAVLVALLELHATARSELLAT